MSLNGRSINIKFQDIRDASHIMSLAALCIQETWGKIQGLTTQSKGTTSQFLKYVVTLI